MRTVWIEAEDELGDAPGVATCFAQDVNLTLPLTPVGDKILAHVVLRFRQVESRIELSVLHHNRQLWSGTAAVATGRAVTTESPLCVAAQELIEYLASAMRSARDRLW